MDKRCTYDPLHELMAYYANASAVVEKQQVEATTIEEKLKQRIINGDRLGIDADLRKALENYSALEIINTLLLDGMRVVGELFGSGQMQLPFVLQSAETMKTAVGFLEPFMEKVEDSAGKGTMVLATVKGDVHDIGKNLVDIILTNNGYRTVNIGIKQTINQIVEAAESNNVDVIG
ncbi:MAG: B12-binding domain-containing protein, partial [Candidatus Kapaibacterium sp.]